MPNAIMSKHLVTHGISETLFLFYKFYSWDLYIINWSVFIPAKDCCLECLNTCIYTDPFSDQRSNHNVCPNTNAKWQGGDN